MSIRDYFEDLFNEWDIEELQDDLDAIEGMDYETFSTTGLANLMRDILTDKYQSAWEDAEERKQAAGPDRFATETELEKAEARVRQALGAAL